MRFRFSFLVLTLALSLLSCSSPATPPVALPKVAPTGIASLRKQVVFLTMGSWRIDDIEAMNRILKTFNEQYPTIHIKFDPTPATEYDAALLAQLREGTGPDLFYLRSFTTSRKLYEQKFLEDLTELPGLKESFSQDAISPWATADGVPYGVPFIATSHGVYYNMDLFRTLELDIPQSWEELLEVAQKIKRAGYTPFANASGDSWTTAEILLMNIIPNFIGGKEGRLEYLDGERCFNDKQLTAAYQALKDLAAFFPYNQSMLKYADSQQLFLQGKAAMWFGGSWDIPFFESSKPAFQWSIFAPPPPTGKSPYLTFHLDAGMGLNAASKNKTQALTFLRWMTTQEFAEKFGDELPGFFPLHDPFPQLRDEKANTFLSLNKGRKTDIRFVWDKLRDGSPDGYTLMEEGAKAVIDGTLTPQEATNMLQSGIEKWYLPARKCSK